MLVAPTPARTGFLSPKLYYHFLRFQDFYFLLFFIVFLGILDFFLGTKNDTGVEPLWRFVEPAGLLLFRQAVYCQSPPTGRLGLHYHSVVVYISENNGMNAQCI